MPNHDNSRHNSRPSCLPRAMTVSSSAPLSCYDTLNCGPGSQPGASTAFRGFNGPSSLLQSFLNVCEPAIKSYGDLHHLECRLHACVNRYIKQLRRPKPPRVQRQNQARTYTPEAIAKLRPKDCESNFWDFSGGPKDVTALSPQKGANNGRFSEPATEGTAHVHTSSITSTRAQISEKPVFLSPVSLFRAGLAPATPSLVSPVSLVGAKNDRHFKRLMPHCSSTRTISTLVRPVLQGMALVRYHIGTSSVRVSCSPEKLLLHVSLESTFHVKYFQDGTFNSVYSVIPSRPLPMLLCVLDKKQVRKRRRMAVHYKALMLAKPVAVPPLSVPFLSSHVIFPEQISFDADNPFYRHVFPSFNVVKDLPNLFFGDPSSNVLSYQPQKDRPQRLRGPGVAPVIVTNLSKNYYFSMIDDALVHYNVHDLVFRLKSKGYDASFADMCVLQSFIVKEPRNVYYLAKRFADIKAALVALKLAPYHKCRECRINKDYTVFEPLTK